MSRGLRVAAILIGVAWTVLLLLKPLQGARLWFDEGWSLVVAKTWALTGTYARPLLGEPVSAVGMAQPPSVTLPIGLSFHLFGVGIWQGRLPGCLFTVGALLLMFALTVRLYSPPIAVGTLGVLLLLMPHVEVHPALIGRQALAEMPMMFYVLAGYLCLLASAQKPWLFLPATASYWGIALTTKGHVLPFWLVSLIVPMGILAAGRRWRPAATLLVVLVGSLGVARVVGMLGEYLQSGLRLYGAPMEGLYGVTAFVLRPHVRLLTLAIVLLVGQPTVLGVAYALRRLWQQRRSITLSPNWDVVVRLSLCSMTSSWLVWYITLSVGWVRYLFPPAFLSSMYVSALLYHLSPRFEFGRAVRRLANAMARRRVDRASIGAGIVLWVLLVAVPVSVQVLIASYRTDPNTDMLSVVGYLNAVAGPDDVIETYDSELLFLLNGLLHYPPDQVQIELNRRTFLRQRLEIPYDPLVADPEFLVVGPHSNMWGLYSPIIDAGGFRLLVESGPYGVYGRVRPKSAVPARLADARARRGRSQVGRPELSRVSYEPRYLRKYDGTTHWKQNRTTPEWTIRYGPQVPLGNGSAHRATVPMS